MKMKKIISALLVGATAAGIATADLSLKANIKLSSMMYSYNTDKEGGSGLKQKQLFNLPGYGDTNNDVTMTAKGNIFTFTAGLTPYADQYDQPAIFRTVTIAANLGDFTFTTGWNRNGSGTYELSSLTTGNDEGHLAQTAYKLGSAFNKSPALFVNNQQAVGKDYGSYFVNAKYALGLGDAVKLNLAASAISPHGFAYSKEGTVYNNYYADRLNRDDRGIAWGAFVNPVIGKIVGFDLTAKGWRTKDDDYNLLFGGYAKLLCVPVMPNAVLGGSVYLKDLEVEEWNADLGLSFNFGSIKLTFNNKFAAMPDNVKKAKGGQAASKYGWGTQYTNDYILWDALGVSFALNDTLTLIGNIGQQSAFGDGEKGTTVFVYPHAQIFASSAVSISAGAVLTLDRIGAKNFADDKMALLVNVPVVVKFGL